MFINEMEPYEYKESIEITDDIILDLDVNNKVVALEILDVSEVFGIEKKYIEQYLESIEADIITTDKLISIKALFTFSLDDESVPKVLDETTENDMGLLIPKTHLTTPAYAK
jgi:uncharacterized protein YuzE